MRRFTMSMRWWLALVFAALVAGTAVAVAQVLTLRSEHAFRERAAELAAGTAVTAANQLSAARGADDLSDLAADTSQSRRIAIFLFDEAGELISSSTSLGITVRSIENVDDIVLTAQRGNRVVQTTPGGRRIVVALPIRKGEATTMVAVASRPDLIAAGDLLRRELPVTIAIAIAVGALVGTLVAVLITRRLRRIARAAAEIEQGTFDEPLEPGFHDELGQLAATVDSMRLHLRDSFNQLGAERDQLRRVFAQLQEGVIAVDQRQRVVFANSRALTMLGRIALVEGSELPNVWGGALRDVVADLFQRGASVVNVRGAPDAEHTYAVAGVPLEEGGETALLVLSDVTIADRRERAEREFVTNAAHELRTPLAAIASAVDVLQTGAKDDPAERDRFLGVIDRQSARLGRLVRSLLTLARAQTRAEPIVLEAVEIRPLLDEVATELRDRGAARIETQCPAGLVARAHHDLLAQAIENLVSNAVRHSDATTIVLSAQALPNRRVRIDVHDDGRGIPAAERDRMFDRFYQGGERDPEGFGLGLPIARAAVSALGGEIELESTEGGGTTASILLGVSGPIAPHDLSLTEVVVGETKQ
jgi:two-component system sensor histidine kinase ResE